MKKQAFILLVFFISIVFNSFFMTASADTIDVDLMKQKVIEVPEEPVEPEILLEEPLEPSRVPVLEYHNFGEEEGRWTRTPENFYSDLLWLYNNDYRPVTVAQFIKMQFPMEPGKKPVILSFDDASEGQFRYLDDGTIDPNSAVGVMNKFVEQYPDFGTSATFFVLPYSFGQVEYIDDKLKYLVQTGREIGSHTFGHEDLSEIDGGTIEWSLASHEIYVQQQLGEPYEVRSLAYPLGHYPDGELFELVKRGSSEGHKYEIDAGFLVGSNPTLMPDDPDFDPYKIPRIQAFEDEWKRWFEREPGDTEKTEKEPSFNPYTVDEEHSIGTQEVPDLAGSIVMPEKPGEPEEIDEPAIEPVEEPATKPPEEIAEPEEPKFPYETCKPLDYVPTPIGKVFWKWAENKKQLVQINKLPEDLKYKDGKFYYTITGEEGLIAEKFLPYASHYRISDFKDAIIATNPDSEFLPEDEIIIPDIPRFLVKRNINPKNLWGIYLTGYYAVSDEGKRLMTELKNRGGSLVVFDVKEIDGFVFYPSEVPLVHETDAQHIIIPNLENFVRYWHDQGIYLTARIVIFKDINLSRERPDLAIQSKSGGLWSNREGSVWVDPSNEETQQYTLDLVEEIAKAGVDEVQFDYIRFPTLGPVENTKYNFDEANTEKYEVISNFVAKVHDKLLPYDTKFSLDVYGVIAWNEGYDAISTGQKMECLGQYIDVVYPMVYPSHFGPGFGGYDSPADHPYYFVSESIKLFKHYLQGTNTKIRPWLQAFPWRVSDYGPWYIDEQVKAANDEGIHEYTLWNAGNFYFE